MIPPFQELMLPLMKLATDRGEASVSNREFIDSLAKEFQLTEADRSELLASGTQSRFENRVYWALVHLRRAGLLESTGRGLNRITTRGTNVLNSQPSHIDLKLLSQFPEFREFRNSKGRETAVDQEPTDALAPPRERIEAASTELRENLITELSERLAAINVSSRSCWICWSQWDTEARRKKQQPLLRKLAMKA